jgi:hypothetical protein
MKNTATERRGYRKKSAGATLTNYHLERAFLLPFLSSEIWVV